MPNLPFGFLLIFNFIKIIFHLLFFIIFILIYLFIYLFHFSLFFLLFYPQKNNTNKANKKKNKKKYRLQLSRRTRRSQRGSERSREDEDIAPELIPQAEVAVLNTLLNGCVIIGDDGYIKYFNPAASKMFGYVPEEVIGHNVKLLMPSMFAANHDKFVFFYFIFI